MSDATIAALATKADTAYVNSIISKVTVINKPVIISPVNLTIDYLGPIESTYSPSANYEGLQSKVIWECALDIDFTNIIDSYEGSDNLTSWSPVIGLPLTQVYVRTKQISDSHRSEYSDVISFTTPDIYVTAPTLTVEGSPSSVTLTPILSGSAFNVFNGSDIHNSTDWRVLKASDNSVVWESLNDTVNLLSIVPSQLPINTDLIFMVRYNGVTYGSSEWASVSAKTLDIYVQNPTLDVAGEPASVTLTPLLTGSTFEIVNGIDTHISSDWRVVRSDNGTVVWESLGDTVNLTSINTGQLPKNTDLVFKVRYNSSLYGSSDWIEVTAKTLVIYVQDPVLTVAGTPDSLTLSPALSTSAFVIVNGTANHVSTDWEIRKVSDDSLVWSSIGDTVNKTSITANGLDILTQYKVRVKYNSDLFGSSNWIEVTGTTLDIYVEDPVLTVAGTPDDIGEKPVLTTSAFSVYNSTDIHASTDWIVEQSGVEVWSSMGDTVNLLTITVPAGYLVESTEYTFKVRHNSAIYGSSNYVSVTGTTKAQFFDYDAAGSIGLELEGGYYAGKIQRADGVYALIVAPKALGQSPTTLQWKNAQTTSGACKSLNNGAINTAHMVASGDATVYPAAHYCNDLVINGYSDWYLPARDELGIAYRNLKPTPESNRTNYREKSSYVYTDIDDGSTNPDGMNNHSIPAGAAHTTNKPAQTTSVLFKQGGAEFFYYDTLSRYCSSTEFSSTLAWVQDFNGNYAGGQRGGSITSKYPVRAFRAIKIG